MSLNLLIGLFLQLVAVTIVLRRTRGRWFSHVGVLFVLVAFIYHGASEIVQMLFPGRNVYRTLVSQDDVDAWVAVVGIALLLFAGAYCFSLRNTHGSSYDPAHLAHWAKHYLPDWRLLLVLAGLSFWVILCGKDFGYWINNLAVCIINFAIITASVAYILESGPHVIFPIMLVQAVLFSLVGARSGVVLNGMILLSILGRLGVPIRWRQMMLLGVAGLLLMVLISAARAVGGRLNDNDELADAGAHVHWLINGLPALIDPATLTDAVADDFIYRLDGNAFNGMVYKKLAEGCPPAGLQSFWNNFSLIVPSFWNPNKLSEKDLCDLYEEDYTAAHYGLPQQIDYTPATAGIIYSYYGSYGLWLIMICLGAMYARIDGWLAGARSTWAFAMGLGFINTSVLMEWAVGGYFLTFRTVIGFYVFSQGLVWANRVCFRGRRERATGFDNKASSEKWLAGHERCASARRSAYQHSAAHYHESNRACENEIP